MEVKEMAIAVVIISSLVIGIFSWQISIYGYYNVPVDSKYTDLVDYANSTLNGSMNMTYTSSGVLAGNTSIAPFSSPTEVVNQQYAGAASQTSSFFTAGSYFSGLLTKMANVTGLVPPWMIGMIAMIIGIIVTYAIISGILRYKF